MAKIRGGILGTVSGKVAGVVGGQWKNKNYVRQYAIPANPNTAGQQAQRGKFSLCVAFAKGLVGQVFNVYSDPFLREMSGYNFFIKSNIDQFTAPINYELIKITQGKLFGTDEMTFTADPTGNIVAATWGTSLGSNGLNTDKVQLVAYNATTGRWAFSPQVLRSAHEITGLALPNDTGDVVVGFLIFSQYTGTKLSLVSDSVAYTAI